MPPRHRQNGIKSSDGSLRRLGSVPLLVGAAMLLTPRWRSPRRVISDPDVRERGHRRHRRFATVRPAGFCRGRDRPSRRQDRGGRQQPRRRQLLDPAICNAFVAAYPWTMAHSIRASGPEASRTSRAQSGRTTGAAVAVQPGLWDHFRGTAITAVVGDDRYLRAFDKWPASAFRRGALDPTFGDGEAERGRRPSGETTASRRSPFSPTAKIVACAGRLGRDRR